MKRFLTQKEMDVVEDMFFMENSEEQYKKMRPVLLRVWKKLCEVHDDRDGR